jgi:hypothetical protein
MATAARKSDYIDALVQGSSSAPAGLRPVVVTRKRNPSDPFEEVMHGDVHNDDAGPPHGDGYIDTGPDPHDDGHIDNS